MSTKGSITAHLLELEAAWKPMLPLDQYKIIRVDGRNFKRFTKDMAKPFDTDFCRNMDKVAVALCKEVQGCQFAYVQSDEISLLVHNEPGSQQWFGGELTKTLSISAGLASSVMALLYSKYSTHEETGRFLSVMFDSRAFAVKDRQDVIRYFLHRQGDAWRNAVTMAAQAHYSHKQLMNKPVWDRLLMLQEVGINFMQAYPPYIWRGRLVTQVKKVELISYTRKDTGEEHTQEVERSHWIPQPAPMFDWDQAGFLDTTVPQEVQK